MDVISEDLCTIRATLPKKLVEGIRQCAQRDSRDEDHILAVALEKYIESRKLHRDGE